MKSVVLILCTLVCGCETMTPCQKAVLAWGATMVVAIAASSATKNRDPQIAVGAIGDPKKPPCTKQPDGSCR